MGRKEALIIQIQLMRYDQLNDGKRTSEEAMFEAIKTTKGYYRKKIDELQRILTTEKHFHADMERLAKPLLK